MYNDSMDTITITKHITHRDVIHRVDIKIDANACCVCVGNDTMVVPWDAFDDVEQLSIIFSDTPLFLFKFIVGMLNQALDMRAAC